MKKDSIPFSNKCNNNYGYIGSLKSLGAAKIAYSELLSITYDSMIEFSLMLSRVNHISDFLLNNYKEMTKRERTEQLKDLNMFVRRPFGKYSELCRYFKSYQDYEVNVNE